MPKTGDTAMPEDQAAVIEIPIAEPLPAPAAEPTLAEIEAANYLRTFAPGE